MGCVINPRYVKSVWNTSNGDEYPSILDTHTGQMDMRACTCTSCASTTDRLIRQLNDGTIRRDAISFCWETR